MTACARSLLLPVRSSIRRRAPSASSFERNHRFASSAGALLRTAMLVSLPRKTSSK
jgi:hypothetical protein